MFFSLQYAHLPPISLTFIVTMSTVLSLDSLFTPNRINDSRHRPFTLIPAMHTGFGRRMLEQTVTQFR